MKPFGAAPKFGGFELFGFLFFGVLVSAATVYCGMEWLRVVNSGALQHTVQVLLSKWQLCTFDIIREAKCVNRRKYLDMGERLRYSSASLACP
jgi:hypothetical protein